MKTILTQIAMFVMLLCSSHLAHADSEGFPASGKVYDVVWAQNAQCANGKIKVIRKGEGTWIFVEITTQIKTKIPQPWSPGSPSPAPEEPMSITSKIWINTQWIVYAAEVESEKKQEAEQAAPRNR